MRLRSLQKLEKGQNLVLFTLVLLGLLAMAALLLDGGMAYANRRTAQAAADASALAAAEMYCNGDPVLNCEPFNSSCAQNTATQYATYNNAALTSFSTDVTSRTVSVTTQIDFPAFFSRVLGRNQLQVSADASALCGCPSGARTVLPVAWTCREPFNTGPNPDDDDEYVCAEKIVSEDYARDYLQTRMSEVPPDSSNGSYSYYIIMDTDCTYAPDGTPSDLTYVCQPLGDLDCDLNDDGRNDIMGCGDRSWLDLDVYPSQGARNMIDWIYGTEEAFIETHMWLAGKDGAATSIFSAVEDQIGKIATVPVFDDICGGDPLNLTNGCTVHDAAETGLGRPDIVAQISEGSTAFHVFSFANFFLTCVQKTPGDNPKCPGYIYLTTDDDPDTPEVEGMGQTNSLKTIEGFFLETNLRGGYGTGGVCTGVYNIVLQD